MSELISRFKNEYMRTKKSLGQHFLTNRHFIEEIADAADLGEGELPVVEIGPGCGVLTEALAKRTSHLTVVEIDDNAAAFLAQNKEEFFTQLEIIHADVMSVDIGTLYDSPVTVVGNLPYNLSVKIVDHCTKYIHNIRKMVFMFQREVAARINASPNSKDYSSLSVFCSYHYEIKKIRDISGGNFWPNAGVYSTVLSFTPRKSFPLEDPSKFLEFVYKAFRQKRKTLRNNLKELKSLPQVLSELGLSESVRAEEISPEQFLTIFRRISDEL